MPGLDVQASGGRAAAVAGNAASPIAENHASLAIHFVSKPARQVQLLPNANYEVRAMYTEAVVRSPALLADYHVGLMARPNSLTGYSLNVPGPGMPAPAGVPRLRYAQHPTDDDPYYPSLVDGTKMINPTADGSIYFLGQGILRTAQTASYPPPVLDPFRADVSSVPVGSFNDVQSVKLGAAAAESLFNDIWSSVTYDDPLGTHAIAPVVQDRLLTDNSTLVTTRYYKWRLPFAATTLSLGTGLPLGRAILDIRLIDAAGKIVASGGSARILQSGSNDLTVSMNYDSQGLVSELWVDLPGLSGSGGSPAALGRLAGDFLGSYSVGSGPHASALDTSGNVWVVNRTAGSLQKVSSGGSVLATYAWFTAPSDVAIDPYGDIWVTDSGTDTVTRLSSGGVLRDVVAVGSAPEALAIDTAGTVWVANSGSDTATKIANSGSVVGTYPVAAIPRDIGLDASGRVWITASGDNTVRVLSSAGALLNTIAAPTTPVSLALDLFGEAWVALAGPGSIGSYNSAGTLLATYASGTGTWGVGLDAAQDTWASAETSGTMGIRAYDGTAIASVPTAAGPRGITIDSYRGSVWLAEYGSGAGNSLRKLATGVLLSVASTLAGNGASGFADGTGSGARFASPAGVAIDAAGNTYVADTANDRIRKITAGGVVSTLAGSGAPGWTDGPGTQARFQAPTGIAVDSSGNVFVADRATHTVRKILPNGSVSTLSGSGQAGFANGAGPVSKFDNPMGIAVAPDGTVYVTEPAMHRIRRVTSGGLTSHFVGSGLATHADGNGVFSSFSSPRGLVVDGDGNLFVADAGNNRIRKVTPGGTVTTHAGTGAAGYLNGPAAAAMFDTPLGLCFDGSGNLYVLDQGNRRIRRISPSGIVTTVGGDGTSGFLDGHPLAMRFSAAEGLAMNASGIMTVADTASHRIRKLAPPPAPTPYAAPPAAPVVFTLAGSGFASSIDGTGTGASFNEPVGIARDSSGNLIVGQSSESRVRRITPTGIVTTVTGTAGEGYTDDGFGAAQFQNLGFPWIDGSGNVLFTDVGNHVVRYLDMAGATASTFAGSTQGFAEGAATDSAQFDGPHGIVQDSGGNTFVADYDNNRIRKIDTLGDVTTFAGSGVYGTGDGVGVGAQFGNPFGLAIDSLDNLYVTDHTTHRVRKVDPAGAVTTIAGSSAGYLDGPAASARFDLPGGVAVDASVNVYVADRQNHRIRKIWTTGVVTTYAGSGGYGAGNGGFVDGSGINARFKDPTGLAIDVVTGRLYVADRLNNRIRVIVP